MAIVTLHIHPNGIIRPFEPPATYDIDTWGSGPNEKPVINTAFSISGIYDAYLFFEHLRDVLVKMERNNYDLASPSHLAHSFTFQTDDGTFHIRPDLYIDQSMPATWDMATGTTDGPENKPVISSETIIPSSYDAEWFVNQGRVAIRKIEGINAQPQSPGLIGHRFTFQT